MQRARQEDGRTIPSDPEIWKQEDATHFVRAKDLVGAVIAAYSSRISRATTPEERDRLLAEQASHTQAARRLAVTDRELVLRVLDEYPQLLTRLRADSV